MNVVIGKGLSKKKKQSVQYLNISVAKPPVSHGGLLILDAPESFTLESDEEDNEVCIAEPSMSYNPHYDLESFFDSTS